MSEAGETPALRIVISMLFDGNERKQRELQMKSEGRLPPGQSLTLKWPVLHYGSERFSLRYPLEPL